VSYRLLLAPKADRQFADLPDDFVELVQENLYALADSPTELSVPIASPPFPPRGQLFHFDTIGAGGVKWFFTVIFRYSQDETALHILSITWRELIDE
jgi:hypothetical protein